MNFFRINPRQDFAGYTTDEQAGEIHDDRIVPPYRKIAQKLSEYLGVPERKPGKRGDLHASAHGIFVRPTACQLMEVACRGKSTSKPAVLSGRESEGFTQLWILNFVDCLDLEKTVAGPPGGFYKDKIGVIKRAVFDESHWDGSDLFVVPQDPSYCLFCTENFVANWKAAKLKGAMFSRYLMDPEAIRC